MKLEDILRSANDVAFWRTVVPFLRIDVDMSVASAIPPTTTTEAERLRASGWARLERAVAPSITRPLADALRCLHDATIPTPFLYVFDEPWALATMLAPTWTALLGATPRVLPDVWAWYIAEGRGWAAHRGVEDPATPLVNVWIALSDVGLESACMHVVPLGGSSERRRPAFGGSVDEAVPLPVPAGSVLAWNAYVLHWGGEMKPGAPPRASLSFTLDPRALPERTPSFEERVDLVADMLVLYENSANVTGPWLEWANLWRGMRAARG
jgi:hypothetical protein